MATTSSNLFSIPRMIDPNCIVSSKLYKTSNRKQKILSRLSTSGINIQLEKQPTGYVHTPGVRDISDEDNKVSDTEEAPEPQTSDDSSDNKDININVNTNPGQTSSLHDKFKKAQRDLSVSDESLEPTVPENTNNYSSSSSSSSSTSVSDNSQSSTRSDVSSSTIVDASLERTYVTDPENICLEIQDIKGYLNSRADTCGVSRIKEKENNELWIYYEDNINLNDVMSSVIETLELPGYSYLEFNRLARSDNAMVFIISRQDTYSGKDPNNAEDDK